MSGLAERERCPDCGTELGSDGASAGLCARCLLSLALLGSVVEPELDLDSEAPTLEGPGPGRILGERYQMRELLGRGGMGEVWRAFDLKLRVDVALKSVRPERVGSAKARELLLQEVRSAREVTSPNVCRIFDLVEDEGRDLVSMEYIDGETLTEALRGRGPLELQEAREVASQFLSGLEAIHRAGLVHRDFKPENVMLTRAGRVVVMDFGLARGLTEQGTGTVAGTPAYMAPEQARGAALDARADVYAAGVVLAEMLSVGGGGAPEARRALWKAVRETPPAVPEGPWSGVLRQALDPDPGARPDSVQALARALEEVTLRPPGFEEKRPYPGLASFTEEDAEYFFGREAEVEAVWKKLKRPRLLALIGPSGTGKSSFVRAGLVPALPSGWAAVVATPGHRPLQSLGQALAPSLAGDAEALRSLVGIDDADTAVGVFSSWRKRHEHALVVVDQFEELFTLNPPEVQEAFAELLGRLVLEADVHVLLSLRDDFLFQCQGHEALGPAFADLTPLGAMGQSGLRRALVQPALACGYRFEDEALVEEMVREVGQERGALPLLAFAASRLWEKRDRERGLLTREAYGEIGGVAGALAQHAESALERIGTQRTPVVRELLRNLVTAQGTRAVREREELLSVFGESEGPTSGDSVWTESGRPYLSGKVATRADAAEVLGALVDARLLTSFERPGEESGESRQEIEIVHESLLSRWPRLVRWQTQDADGAQLRDQLRQAAQAWEERGRPEDLLWSGTAYRDLAVWRERYAGGLTATEEGFTQAAEHHAGRQRRRRRAMGAGLLAAAAGVAIVTSVLWREADAERARAQAETRRAEASKLLVLGQAGLEDYPTGALAYAMASLELADTEPGRLLALRALQAAPLARIASLGGEESDGGAALYLDFSRSGEWIAAGGYLRSDVLHRDGDWRLAVGSFASAGQAGLMVEFGPRSDVLVGNLRGDVGVWSLPGGEERRRFQPRGGEGSNSGASPVAAHVWKDGFLALATMGGRVDLSWWPFGEGESRDVGSMEAVDVTSIGGSAIGYSRGSAVFTRSLPQWAAPQRRLGAHPEDVVDLSVSPDGARLASIDGSGEIRVWRTSGGSPQPESTIQAPGMWGIEFDPSGRWLAARGRSGTVPTMRLYDLRAAPGTEPLVLQRADSGYMNRLAFDGEGRWLASAHAADVALWWLGGARPRILRGHGAGVQSLAFTPDGRQLVSVDGDGVIRSWPLTSDGEVVREVARIEPSAYPGLVIEPSGRRVLVPGRRGRVHLIPLEGGPARTLEGFSEETDIMAVAFGEGGRLAAAAPYIGPRADKVVRVWNLDTGEIRVLGPLPGAEDGFPGGVRTPDGLVFAGPARILAASNQVGTVAIDTATGEIELVETHANSGFRLSHDRSLGVGWRIPGEMSVENVRRVEAFLFRTDGSGRSPLPGFPGFGRAAFDRSDRLLAVSSYDDGTIRVAAVGDGEPHLLLGHEGPVGAIAFSNDGKWLATGGRDTTVRIWPVPDVTLTPMHRRPLGELMGTLRSHTNLRAVVDDSSATGYRLEPGPFPGWSEPPVW